MCKFDVIIPVGPKDVRFVLRVVDFLSRCLEGVNHIYILTAAGNFQKVEKRISKWGELCVLVDENKLLPGLSLDVVDEMLKKYSPIKNLSAGWYFQQFLKLGFAQSKYCKDYYLSWDADTLPLAPIKFVENGHLLFNPKNEYNLNYFKTIERLFGYGKQTNFSFISENMIFSQKIVCEMLAEIEKAALDGNTWMEKILRACDLDNPMPAFSEFETYGTYFSVNYPDLYKPRYLNTFREAGYICGRNISEDKLRVMSFDLDTASFEMAHAPMFPYNFPHIVLKIKECLKRIKSMDFNELIIRIRRKLIHRQNADEQIMINQIYRLPQRKY